MSRENVKAIRKHLRLSLAGFTIQSRAHQRWLKAVIAAVLTQLHCAVGLGHLEREEQSHAAAELLRSQKTSFFRHARGEGQIPL